MLCNISAVEGGCDKGDDGEDESDGDGGNGNCEDVGNTVCW